MSAIINYVNNRTIRLNTPFKIINGIGYYVVNGELISECSFNKKYPLRNKLNNKIDLDSRRSYLRE